MSTHSQWTGRNLSHYPYFFIFNQFAHWNALVVLCIIFYPIFPSRSLYGRFPRGLILNQWFGKTDGSICNQQRFFQFIDSLSYLGQKLQDSEKREVLQLWSMPTVIYKSEARLLNLQDSIIKTVKHSKAVCGIGGYALNIHTCLLS